MDADDTVIQAQKEQAVVEQQLIQMPLTASLSPRLASCALLCVRPSSLTGCFGSWRGYAGPCSVLASQQGCLVTVCS